MPQTGQGAPVAGGGMMIGADDGALGGGSGIKGAFETIGVRFGAMGYLRRRVERWD